MSHRFRTLALVALLPIVFAVLGVAVLQGQLRSQLTQAVETRLGAEAQGFEALYDQRRIVALREAIAYRSLRGDPAGSHYLLTDRRGDKLAGTLDAWPKGLPFDGPATARLIAGDPYLVQARELRGGFGLLIGISLEPMQTTLSQMLRVFAAFGAVMLVAGLGAAWWVARIDRARTARLNVALARVGGAGGLDLSLPKDAPLGSEHAILTGHIEAMLARISNLFEAHQRLGNAVAHEMRTPLARIRTRLDALDLDVAARAGLDEEIRSTIRLFDSLLSIAQMDAEAGNATALVPVDLGRIAADIVELYHPVAEEEGRHLKGNTATEAMILGDPQLLSQMVSNLVENGIKYTRPGDTIRVSVRRDGTRVHLRVEDNGPGVPDDLRARIFTPFARGNQVAEVPGHGLGLSLVRAIALRHGAKPQLVETQKGFAIEVTALHFSANKDTLRGR